MNAQKRIIATILLVLLCPICIAQCTNNLLYYIQTRSDIQDGGSSIYSYNNKTYIISVVSLVVGNKNEYDCKKVGGAKAKKEMLSFINGSDITSYTELTTSESLIETMEGRKVEAKQEYVEYIKEEVIGTINQTVPLGGWYSEDRSVYYFAIYKIVE